MDHHTWITKDLKKQIIDRNRLFTEGKKVEGKIAKRSRNRLERTS